MKKADKLSESWLQRIYEANEIEEDTRRIQEWITKVQEWIIEAGYRSVELMKGHVKSTMRSGSNGRTWRIFRSFFNEAVQRYGNPVLVSGTDGVGTKLKLAFLLNRHDTIGIDCVAMCVNDIACAGGEPLFFWIILHVARMNRKKIAQIVKGRC